MVQKNNNKMKNENNKKIVHSMMRFCPEPYSTKTWSTEKNTVCLHRLKHSTRYLKMQLYLMLQDT